MSTPTETSPAVRLTVEDLAPLLDALRQGHQRQQRHFPGEPTRRQPVHTVYGGAQLFRRGTPARLGAMALQAMDAYAPDPLALGRVLGLAEELAEGTRRELVARFQDDPAAVRDHAPEAWLALTLDARVRAKLVREPVEDFRIDFEDGYGHRPDAEEDGHAVSTARELAAALEADALPFSGIRIKPLTPELQARSLRTLDLFLSTLCAELGGPPPETFVVTLPKITQPEEAEALATALALLEDRLDLPEGCLRLELMVETPQSIFGANGRVALPGLVAAARGRCVAAHFGTYDYTASVNVTAAYQHMAHPSCDFARHVMQVALAATGLTLSDGATNVLPVPPHRAAPGETLSAAQQDANQAAVHDAWRLHYGHVRRSLTHGYYQGWDLHPAQLVTRYAAVYAFFLEELDSAGTRLKNFVEKAAQATLVGDVFDDAATGQGLLNTFLRALNCGALTEDEALAATGLTLEELRSRSFAAILDRRRST